ncbi:alpha-L-fucosidase [Leifsonia sp. Root227]|uniref:glycoside hydrolase family 95 protein n=1 Tax=Leifsonia sp. Root227 TaxID=1736496 RepID=UPI0006F79103|nr:glycoside hydrolase family 95 protein [Leifsonia sp. Root227]KRC51730.1 alpha-L-fucosidase [Leifsonia sp. Root227]
MLTITDDASDGQIPAARSGSLHYERPASNWFEALPIGNGRLAAMVFGGIETERIDLSESTAWSGAPASTDVNRAAAGSLGRVRELLFAGEARQAQELAVRDLLGRPTSFGTNLPLPDVVVAFGHGDRAEGYSRRLDLDDAIVTTRYLVDGADISREVFASHPHGLIAVQLRSGSEGALAFRVGFATDVIPGAVSSDTDTVTFDGHAFETLHSDGTQGVRVLIRATVASTDGTITVSGDALEVADATVATLYIAVGTDWRGEHPDDRVDALLAQAAADGYERVRADHIADHGALMARSTLRIGETDSSIAALPTDERHRRLARGERDDALLALYYQYGRYLTIAGSRADSPLPLALQGQWNDGLASSASWTNDFHLDMNTQQNYWAAEPTGLGECQEPLFGLLDLLAETGRVTAREMYGADGWVAHTVTNAWGYTAPGSGAGWGMNVTGGAWLALQLWEHFEYSRDLAFLGERAYPVLRDAARFLLDYLVLDPETGWLVAGPADSPENWYVTEDGSPASLAMGNTVDRVFSEAILRIAGEAAKLLDVDETLQGRILVAREKLPPFQVGRHGQLQEWLLDYEEHDPAHRHTSHLCALYPERQIGPRATPELAEAARVTIQRRMDAPGWEQVEWVEANFTVYFARLLDGDAALRHYTRLITDTSEVNLMSYSAGGVAGATQNIYSFDGNAGGTAGVAEMLLQSDGEVVELLPALPAAWKDGRITGLRAKGGYVLDLSWSDGVLDEARIAVAPGATAKPIIVRYGDETLPLEPTPGLTTTISPR